MAGSGSSGSPADPAHTASRWEQVRRLLAQVAPRVAEFDPRGVDIYFVGSCVKAIGARCGEQIMELFSRVEPRGTPARLTTHMQEWLEAYVSAVRYDRGLRPLNLVVFTDYPKDTRVVSSFRYEVPETYPEDTFSIQASVMKLLRRGCTPHQLSIEFVRVGDDIEAARRLRRVEVGVNRHTYARPLHVVGVTPFTEFQGQMGPNALLDVVRRSYARI
eukprot:TRINITY_DN3279_c0_g2_i1.p1 TRINITY_DN3279_c0_g2~~TRINITY_DN3279_c0_g2_i1.p1  ORF type:complete len:234 (+),score=9.47 TRINITY_DN3279_c0_g2_i1:53-703(+)